MLVYLEKSFVLQVQEVTCELQGTRRLGGRPDALFYIPASVPHTPVSLYHIHQGHCTTGNNVTPHTTMQCTTYDGVIVPHTPGSLYHIQRYNVSCTAVPSAVSPGLFPLTLQRAFLCLHHFVVTFP